MIQVLALLGGTLVFVGGMAIGVGTEQNREWKSMLGAIVAIFGLGLILYLVNTT